MDEETGVGDSHYHLYSVEKKKGTHAAGHVLGPAESLDSAFRTTSTAAISLEYFNDDDTSSPAPSEFSADDDANIHAVLLSVADILSEQQSLAMGVLLVKNHYFMLITDNNSGQYAILILEREKGRFLIRVVVPVSGGSRVRLDGDGGFLLQPPHEKGRARRVYKFKPASVQSLWSAVHTLLKILESVGTPHKGDSWPWLSKYHRMVEPEKEAHDEADSWSFVEPARKSVIEVIRENQRQLEASVAHMKEKTIDSELEKKICVKLKEILFSSNLDTVTSKQVKDKLEDHFGTSLRQFKRKIDHHMMTIMGQMDAASKIFDYLYLGTEWNASNKEELERNNCRFVLNVTREIPNYFPSSIQYYNVRIWDVPSEDIWQHWEQTYRFIRRARESGSSVLVHCKMGVSRSASTVIAYAMKQHNWSLEEAHAFVKKRRRVVKPNEGFKQQLVLYEGILRASREAESWGTKIQGISEKTNSLKRSPKLGHKAGAEGGSRTDSASSLVLKRNSSDDMQGVEPPKIRKGGGEKAVATSSPDGVGMGDQELAVVQPGARKESANTSRSASVDTQPRSRSVVKRSRAVDSSIAASQKQLQRQNTKIKAVTPPDSPYSTPPGSPLPHIKQWTIEEEDKPLQSIISSSRKDSVSSVLSSRTTVIESDSEVDGRVTPTIPDGAHSQVIGDGNERVGEEAALIETRNGEKSSSTTHVDKIGGKPVDDGRRPDGELDFPENDPDALRVTPLLQDVADDGPPHHGDDDDDEASSLRVSVHDGVAVTMRSKRGPGARRRDARQDHAKSGRTAGLRATASTSAIAEARKGQDRTRSKQSQDEQEGARAGDGSADEREGAMRTQPLSRPVVSDSSGSGQRRVKGRVSTTRHSVDVSDLSRQQVDSNDSFIARWINAVNASSREHAAHSTTTLPSTLSGHQPLALSRTASSGQHDAGGLDTLHKSDSFPRMSVFGVQQQPQQPQQPQQQPQQQTQFRQGAGLMETSGLTTSRVRTTSTSSQHKAYHDATLAANSTAQKSSSLTREEAEMMSKDLRGRVGAALEEFEKKQREASTERSPNLLPRSRGGSLKMRRRLSGYEQHMQESQVVGDGQSSPYHEALPHAETQQHAPNDAHQHKRQDMHGDTRSSTASVRSSSLVRNSPFHLGDASDARTSPQSSKAASSTTQHKYAPRAHSPLRDGLLHSLASPGRMDLIPCESSSRGHLSTSSSVQTNASSANGTSPAFDSLSSPIKSLRAALAILHHYQESRSGVGVHGSERGLARATSPSQQSLPSVLGWGAEQVGQWVSTCPPPTCLWSTVMHDNGVTGRDLVDLSHEDLVSIGVKTLHERKAILREVTALLMEDCDTSDVDCDRRRDAETPSSSRRSGIASSQGGDGSEREVALHKITHSAPARDTGVKLIVSRETIEGDHENGKGDEGDEGSEVNRAEERYFAEEDNNDDTDNDDDNDDEKLELEDTVHHTLSSDDAMHRDLVLLPPRNEPKNNVSNNCHGSLEPQDDHGGQGKRDSEGELQLSQSSSHV